MQLLFLSISLQKKKTTDHQAPVICIICPEIKKNRIKIKNGFFFGGGVEFLWWRIFYHGDWGTL